MKSNSLGIKIHSQGFIQGVVGGALVPRAPSSAPLEKPLTQRMKRCDLVPAPFKNLHIPDCPPCMQILYETLTQLRIAGKVIIIELNKSYSKEKYRIRIKN